MRRIFLKFISAMLSLVLIISIALNGNVYAIDEAALCDITSYLDTQNHYEKVKVSIKNRYNVIEKGYKDKYDIQEGIFTFGATTEENLDAVYYYSDGYFKDAPDVYNDSLSTMSLSLAMAAFNACPTAFDEAMADNVYANRFRNVKQLLSDLGVSDKNIYISDFYSKKPENDSVGVIIGAKEINVCDDNDENFILVPIAIRGSGYEREWSSNFHIGKDGEFAGFSNASYKLQEYLQEFIESDMTIDLKKALSEGKVKFWLTGFSKAGAIANITAKRLTDIYGKNGNQIYAYCFEAPKGGMESQILSEEWTYDGKYLNIHNIINTGDFITYLGPEIMGFVRYGVDHYIPDAESTDYVSQRNEMVKHLHCINDAIVFDDSFSLAALDFMSFNSKKIVELENGKDYTIKEWNKAFLDDMLFWILGSDENGEEYRDFFVDNNCFGGGEYVSLEYALQFVFYMFYDYQYELVDVLSYRLKDLSSNVFLLLDMYFSVIKGWKTQSADSQKRYLEQMWSYLDQDMFYSDGTPVKKITDFVNDEEKDELKNTMFTLMSFLFAFVSLDSNMSPSLTGVVDKQVHLGTLINNGNIIAQNHYSEVCLAWLRTNDSNYDVNDVFEYEDVAVLLVNDSDLPLENIEADFVVNGNKVIVELYYVMGEGEGVDSKALDNGSAIYYQISEDNKPTTEWMLYQEPFEIDVKVNCEYSINVFSSRFEQRSSIKTFCHNEICKDLSGYLIVMKCLYLSYICVFVLITVLIAIRAFRLRKYNNRGV